MSKHVNLTCSNKGIGDAVIGFYVALMLSRSWSVCYYTHCAAWFEPLLEGIDLSQHNIAVLRYEAGTGIDLFKGYEDEFKNTHSGSTRFNRYLTNALDGITATGGVKLPITDLHRRIFYLTEPEPPLHSEYSDYIIIAPFASVKGREWPFSHVARLVRLLAEAGEKVALVCGKNERTRMLRNFGGIGLPCRLFIGAEPAELIARLKVCKMLIAIDSGMAHIGNLYQIPTLVIMAQLPFQFIFDEHTRASTTKGITPESKCSPCFFQAPVHTKECQTLGCSAMGSISVERVFNFIKDR